MRKLFFFLLVATAFSVSAQKQIVWFDCGLKVQGGASGFYSKAIEDAEGINHELGLTSGFGYGGKLGFNKNYGGLSLEVMFNKSKQNIEVLNVADAGYSYEWKTLDVYALYRNAKNLGYFEIGPKYSKLNKMENVSSIGGRTDITNNFNGNNFAGVLGFGANIMGNDGRFSGILGLRFEYGFTDIVKKDINIVPTATRTATNPYFAGLVFEFNWGIGYFGKAQCGARSKFIMF
jgi:hypothetical protein